MYASTPEPVAVPTKTPLLINRNYALLWSGQAISVLGDMVFDTTLVLWIATRIAHGQSWAPLAVSGVLLAASIPIVLIGTFAGVFVDRWDKRCTMLGADALRALLILSLLPVAGIGPVRLSLPVSARLGAVYAVVFLAAAASQFFSPARMTIIQDIVPRPLLARASGLGQAIMPIATILGPPLAAPLFFLLGPQWALGMNALSFALSFTAVWLVQAPAVGSAQKAAAGFWSELTAGLRFFVAHPILRTILIVGVIATLGAGCINALDIFFVTQNLHAPAALYGVIGAIFGAGFLAGAILAGSFAERIGLTRTFWASALACAGFMLLYARMTSIVPAAVVLFLAAMPMAGLNVAVQPLVLASTPRELVGRVGSVLNPAISLATLISIGIAGWLDSTVLHGFHTQVLGLTFGPVDTIFTAGGLILLAGALYAWLALRRLSPETAA